MAANIGDFRCVRLNSNEQVSSLTKKGEPNDCKALLKLLESPAV